MSDILSLAWENSMIFVDEYQQNMFVNNEIIASDANFEQQIEPYSAVDLFMEVPTLTKNIKSNKRKCSSTITSTQTMSAHLNKKSCPKTILTSELNSPFLIEDETTIGRAHVESISEITTPEINDNANKSPTLNTNDEDISVMLNSIGYAKYIKEFKGMYLTLPFDFLYNFNLDIHLLLDHEIKLHMVSYITQNILLKILPNLTMGQIIQLQIEIENWHKKNLFKERTDEARNNTRLHFPAFSDNTKSCDFVSQMLKNMHLNLIKQ